MTNGVDKRARQKGYLIYKSNELYVKQLTRNSEVYIQRNNKSFMAYRLTFKKGNPKATSERTIVKSTDLMNAFNRAEAYIERYMEYVNSFKKSK